MSLAWLLDKERRQRCFSLSVVAATVVHTATTCPGSRMRLLMWSAVVQQVYGVWLCGQVCLGPDGGAFAPASCGQSGLHCEHRFSHDVWMQHPRLLGFLCIRQGYCQQLNERTVLALFHTAAAKKAVSAGC